MWICFFSQQHPERFKTAVDPAACRLRVWRTIVTELKTKPRISCMSGTEEQIYKWAWIYYLNRVLYYESEFVASVYYAIPCKVHCLLASTRKTSRCWNDVTQLLQLLQPSQYSLHTCGGNTSQMRVHCLKTYSTMLNWTVLLGENIASLCLSAVLHWSRRECGVVRSCLMTTDSCSDRKWHSRDKRCTIDAKRQTEEYCWW